MGFDWVTMLERFGFPVAMAVWLLIESRANRKALEQREARYQAESTRRVAEAAEACAKDSKQPSNPAEQPQNRQQGKQAV